MVSERVQRIGFSATLRIAAKALQMRKEGVDVIDLSVGEPDFPTPLNIKEAAKRALDRDLTKYTANDGIIELREAVCRKFQQESGANYKPDQVIISTGAKQCLYNAFQALLNKGDEVIIPAPYWVSYPHMVNLAKGVPVFVMGREENGFRITPEDLGRSLTARTRAIILNNPSNPTGAAYNAEQLQKIVDICMDEGIFIISDEIYEKLVYDGFYFVSVAALGDKVRQNCLVVNGFSKAFSMTGWRLGYAVGPREVIEGISKVQSHQTSNPTSIVQWAGVEALTGPQNEINRMRSEFERRRNYCLYRLQSIPHLSCTKPEGAFYLFPNCEWYYDKQYEGVEIRNSAGLAYYLLKFAHIALVPGESFGADKFIRISYATSMKNLEEGLTRLIEALAKLKPTTKAKRAELDNTVTKVKDFVELEPSISPRVKDGLVAEAEVAMPYDNYQEWNVNIGGIILKLATNSKHLLDFWIENWYPSPLESDLEPHGIIYGVKDAAGREPRAFYAPESRSAFLFNSAYYPQLRALALGMVDSISAAAFDALMIGGACLDVNGRGVALITPPGTGGGTHFSNLLRRNETRLHSYDGFFIRWASGTPVADSVERKLLLKTDLSEHLPELARLFDRSKLENVVTKLDDCEVEACPLKEKCPLERGELCCYIASRRSRAMVDPYWLGGTNKHIKRTVLSKIILLKRESLGPKLQKPSTEQALRILEEGAVLSPRGGYRSQPFYNPYYLNLNPDRMEQLRRQWKRLLEVAPLVVVNTEAMGLEEAKDAIGKSVGL